MDLEKGLTNDNRITPEFYHDNFQNYKRYNIKKAQLVIADIPYNIGDNAYGSNPMWYNGGTIRMEKANTLNQISLTETDSLTLQSICTFATSF